MKKGSGRGGVAEQLRLPGTPVPPAAPEERFPSLSVSAMVQFSRCPRQFYWSAVRPLPRRFGAAARRGQGIHRWIETRSAGQEPLEDPGASALAPREIGRLAGEVHRDHAISFEERLKSTWRASRFSAAIPRFTEQPFAISLPGGGTVRGRIDAVYVHEDGNWELVDYKTGREPDEEDVVARLQLAIYSLAAQEIWKVDPHRLMLTYFYLASGRADATPAVALETTVEDLAVILGSVRAGRFDPSPGPSCASCDFLRFCGAGRRHVWG